jgi:hypothetical protein
MAEAEITRLFIRDLLHNKAIDRHNHAFANFIEEKHHNDYDY